MATSKSGYDITPLSQQRITELAQHLTPQEREVILDHGTERPFCGVFLDNHQDGTYICRLCELPLFASDAKFDSGTGWPSFGRSFDAAHIKTIDDLSLGMRRVEIRCARCDAHLGHVFNDGPPPTGQRYCLNSIAMQFVGAGQTLEPRKS